MHVRTSSRYHTGRRDLAGPHPAYPHACYYFSMRDNCVYMHKLSAYSVQVLKVHGSEGDMETRVHHIL